MSLEMLERASEQLMNLIPTEDDGWDEQTQPYAEDAAAALTYAYRTALTGDAQEAVWAGRCAYETMDHFAGQKGIDSSYDEDARLQHRAVQAELDRQARDVAELGQLDETTSVHGLDALRRRAEQEASLAFSE